MMTMSIRRFVFAASLVCSLQLSHGQAPNGDYSFTFGGQNSFVYDLSGDYKITQPTIVAGAEGATLSFVVSVLEDARGHLTGVGTTVLEIGNNNFVAAEYRVSGSASRGGPRLPHVSLIIRLRGEDMIGGVLKPFNVSINYNLDIDPNTQSFIGRSRGSARFGSSTAAIRSDGISEPLPVNAGDGTFDANVNIIALNGLTGGGNIILANGRVLPVKLSGAFSASSGRSRIQLTGINEAKGSNLSVIFFQGADEIIIERVNGRILGLQVVESTAGGG